MRKVILESPFAGNVERNTEYARAAMLDSLSRGESPLVSHLLYTQVLDDQNPNERALGIAAGHGWIEHADAMVVYHDLGVSLGMWIAIQKAEDMGLLVVYRKLNRRNI